MTAGVRNVEAERQLAAAAERHREMLASMQELGRPEAGQHVAVKAVDRAVRLVCFALRRGAEAGIPEPRLVVIKPYESNQLRNIEDAIRNSDLGLNPTNDGNVIRVSIPQLTEERRRDLVKQAKAKGEDARVSVRNIRRKAMEELHRIARDGETGEDDVARAEKELQGTTDRYVHQVDDLVKHKESELLEV